VVATVDWLLFLVRELKFAYQKRTVSKREVESMQERERKRERERESERETKAVGSATLQLFCQQNFLPI